MKYTSVRKAKFIKRPNRFLAHVILEEGLEDGQEEQEEIVHVKNTGRCREILIEGVKVIVEKSRNVNRKTKYSLIAVYKGDTLINIDSQVPNTVVYEGIKNGQVKEIGEVIKVSKEVTYGNSRFDIYFEGEDKKGFVEVKGVTLEEEGIAMFPDAPTERGSKHIYEMIKAVEEGYRGFIFFLIQMKGVSYFTPFEIRDPMFAKALRLATEKGVKILAYDSLVLEDEIILGEPVEIRL